MYNCSCLMASGVGMVGHFLTLRQHFMENKYVSDKSHRILHICRKFPQICPHQRYWFLSIDHGSETNKSGVCYYKVWSGLSFEKNAMQTTKGKTGFCVMGGRVFQSLLPDFVPAAFTGKVRHLMATLVIAVQSQCDGWHAH